MVLRDVARRLDGLISARRRAAARQKPVAPRAVARKSTAARGLGRERLLRLVRPPLDDVLGDRMQMVRRDERGRRDGGVLVDHRRLEEPLHALDHLPVDDPAQRPDRVWSVDDLEVRLHVLGWSAESAATPTRLHNRRRDHDDIVRDRRQLLDHEVDHLPQRAVFVLEQLGHAEEERRRLDGAKALADIEQVDDLGEEDATLARRDGRLAERSSLEEDLRSRQDARRGPRRRRTLDLSSQNSDTPPPLAVEASSSRLGPRPAIALDAPRHSSAASVASRARATRRVRAHFHARREGALRRAVTREGDAPPKPRAPQVATPIS